MQQNLAVARTTPLTQKVQGEITWDIYVRLRRFVKQQRGRRIQVIVGQAIKEYLDRQGKGS